MVKISVVIPVYNVEAYLSKCLDSVCHQTFDDIEIICVNDCSSDNSAEILAAYAQKDRRVKIITHDKNSGLSAARNTGLKKATGEFIYFLDSDDWIELDFLQKMYDAITLQNQKAVCCTNILSVTEDNQCSKLIKRDFEKGIYPYYKACQMAWSWLLRKDFLKQFEIVFPEGLKYEDTYFFYVLIRSLDDVYITNETTYYHFENKNSIMGQSQNRVIKDFDIIKIVELIYEKYKKDNKLSVWSVPFFYLPKYMLYCHENKEKFFDALRDLFLFMQKDIIANRKLYSGIEMDFFCRVVDCQNYKKFSGFNISILENLRKHTLKGVKNEKNS